MRETQGAPRSPGSRRSAPSDRTRRRECRCHPLRRSAADAARRCRRGRRAASLAAHRLVGILAFVLRRPTEDERAPVANEAQQQVLRATASGSTDSSGPEPRPFPSIQSVRRLMSTIDGSTGCPSATTDRPGHGAVESDDRARDVAPGIAREEQRRSDDLVGPADPSGRDRSFHPRHHFRGPGIAMSVAKGPAASS